VITAVASAALKPELTRVSSFEDSLLFRITDLRYANAGLSKTAPRNAKETHEPWLRLAIPWPDRLLNDLRMTGNR